MRTALYIRVSTEEQAEEGYSIAAQKDRLTAFCHSQGWDVVDLYVEDGKSAKDMDRPELQRLLYDSSQNKFDIVLVYKLDRLTRSVMDLYSLLQQFEQNNVKFKSATEVYDTTTAMGRLFITLVAALAQWERENLAERVRFGMEQMVAEGKRPGGPIPYGYDKDHHVIPEEKTLLHSVRKFYMDGLGFRSIAKKLNEMGRLKRGTEWTTYSVWYVLDNPYYAGLLRWGSKNSKGKYVNRKKEDQVQCIIKEGEHEPIFSREQYEEHISEMKRRSFNGHSKVVEYWFATVLKCARCGSAMTGRHKINKLKNGGQNKIIFYICANRQQGKGCTMPMFQQRLVEKLVMDHIATIKLNMEKLNAMDDQGPANNQFQEELAELERELKKIHDRKKKWQYAYADDLMSREELQERTSEARESEAFILSRIEEIKSELNFEDHNTEAKELMIDLPELWEELDDKEKNQLAKKIFKYITVDTPLERGLGKKNQLMPGHIVEMEYN